MYMASTYLPTYLPDGGPAIIQSLDFRFVIYLPTIVATATLHAPTPCLCFVFLSALECLALLQALHIRLLPLLFVRLLRLFPLFVARPSRDSLRILFPPPRASCIIRKQMWIMTVGWEEEVGQGEETERESESVSGFGKPTFLGFFVRALLWIMTLGWEGKLRRVLRLGKIKATEGRGGWGWEFVAELFHHSYALRGEGEGELWMTTCGRWVTSKHSSLKRWRRRVCLHEFG